MGKGERIHHECEGRKEKKPRDATRRSSGRIFLSYPILFLAHHCIYLFKNKLPEVSKYATMQFRMMTSPQHDDDVLGKIAWVR